MACPGRRAPYGAAAGGSRTPAITRAAASGSSARMSVSPTSTASTPTCSKSSTSRRESMPDSDHDRLSEYLDRVEKGTDVVVTRRGRPVARLSAVDREDPLDDLIRRGLLTPPARPRKARKPRAKARGSVSNLVAAQRR